MLAPQIYNPGSRGQNARFDIRGLPEVRPGVFSDGVYEYDANGLALNRPDSFVRGLKPADQMDGDQWGDYLGPNRPRWRPDPQPEQPRHDLSGDVAEVPAPRDPNRVPDRENPRAVQYALMRLAQLRALGYDFDIVEGDPTATWRNASVGVAEEARRLGYENPRDWLAGRPKPRPTRQVPADFYESDVRDPVEMAPARPRPGQSRVAPARQARPARRAPDVVQRAVRARPMPKRAPARPVRRGRPVRAV